MGDPDFDHIGHEHTIEEFIFNFFQKCAPFLEKVKISQDITVPSSLKFPKVSELTLIPGSMETNLHIFRRQMTNVLNVFPNLKIINVENYECLTPDVRVHIAQNYGEHVSFSHYFVEDPPTDIFPSLKILSSEVQNLNFYDFPNADQIQGLRIVVDVAMLIATWPFGLRLSALLRWTPRYKFETNCVTALKKYSNLKAVTFFNARSCKEINTKTFLEKDMQGVASSEVIEGWEKTLSELSAREIKILTQNEFRKFEEKLFQDSPWRFRFFTRNENYEN